MKLDWKRWLAFVCCTALLFARGWGRIAHPGIWAEDGLLFLQDALYYSWSVIFKPDGGYIQFLPRLVITLSTHLPFRWIPAFICTVSYCLAGWVFSLFSGRRYQWLVASDSIRFAFCLLFCFAPGLEETLSNTANFYTVLFFGLGLIGLQDWRTFLRWGDACFSVVAIASCGAGFLFFPLFAYRYFSGWKRGLRQELRAEGLILGSMALFTVLNFIFRKQEYIQNRYRFNEILKSTLSVFFAEHLSAPVLGTFCTMWVLSFSEWVMLLIGLIFFIGIVFQLKRTRFSLTPYLLFEAGILGWPLLTFIVRTEAIRAYSPERMAEVDFWGIRYSFLVTVAGMLLWGVTLGQFSRKGRKVVSAAIAVFFLLAFHKTAFELCLWGDKVWGPDADRLEASVKTGEPPEVVIPTYPGGGWQIRYNFAEARAHR